MKLIDMPIGGSVELKAADTAGHHSLLHPDILKSRGWEPSHVDPRYPTTIWMIRRLV